MAKVKCPNCQTLMSIDAIPASGRVFCNGCGQQLYQKKESAPAAPSGPLPVARVIQSAPIQARAVTPKAVPVAPQDDDDEVIDLQAKPATAQPLPVARAVIVRHEEPQKTSSSSSNIRPPSSRNYDEEANRPRRLKKKKKSGSATGIWIAAGSAAVLVIAGLCLMLYIVMGGQKEAERIVLPNSKELAALGKQLQKNVSPPKEEADPGEPFSPFGRNRTDAQPDNKTAGNDAPTNNNPATDGAESSQQPANFGGSGEGSGADVYTYMLKSMVWLLSPMKDQQHLASGSGSLIDKKNRLVLTNHHVAGDFTETVAFFPNYDKAGKLIAERDRFLLQFRNRREAEKRIITAKVVATNPRCDLCILQLSKLPSGVEGLPLSKASSRVGQRVHSVGNPGTSGALWVYAPGVVRQVYHKKWQAHDEDGSVSSHEADVIETQSPTNHGDSGGPLVNDRGELVGVTQGVLPSQGTQLSLFIDIAEVRRFVETTAQNDLHTTWEPTARIPLTGTGGGAMMTGNLTDLVKALGSTDSKQKTKAAEALGELGDKAKDAIPSLLKLLSDPDDFTKRTALSALVKIGLPNKGDVPLLANAFHESSVELRRYAATTLEKMGPDARGAANELATAIGDNDPLVRQASARALGKLGRDVKDTAVRPLELLLNDPNKDNRLAAAEGLADVLGASGDLEALRKLLKHQDNDVRPFAVKAFAKMGKNAKPVLPELLEMAKGDTGDVRRATVQLLALFDPIDSKPGLSLVIESLSSGDKETKIAALAALGTLAKEAPPTVVNNVKEMVKDNEMKKAAITALAKLGTVQKSAVMTLAELLKENDEESQDAVTKAIIDLGAAAVPAVNELIKLMDVPGSLVTHEDETRVSKYAGILAKIGKPAVPALRRGLASRSITRWGCAKALGEMGPVAKDAVRDLQLLLAQEVNGFIRKDVEEAIRKILNQ